MATEITDVFHKQPRETKWIPVSFAALLAAHGDTVDPAEPVTLDVVPAGIVVEDSQFDDATSLFQMLVSGGTNNRSYELTMWLNTAGGQKLEHEVRIKVKEKKA